MKIEGTPEPLREGVRVARCFVLAIEFRLRRLPSILKRSLRPKKTRKRQNLSILLRILNYSIITCWRTSSGNDSLTLDAENLHLFALELKFFPLYFNFKFRSFFSGFFRTVKNLINNNNNLHSDDVASRLVIIMQ